MAREGKPFDWGEVAAAYDRWYDAPEGRMYDRLEKEALARRLPRGGRRSRLLEVGCGTGHWAEWFARLGYRVDGVDLARGMIETAEAKGLKRAAFTLADARALPFDDGTFDTVAAVAALEFLGDPPGSRAAAEAALSEMVRVARSGGTVLVAALNRLAPLNRARLASGAPPWDTAQLFTPRELRDLFARALPAARLHIETAAFVPRRPRLVGWAPLVDRICRLLHRPTGAMIIASALKP